MRSPEIPEGASYAIDTLKQAGFEAVLVGGCVRDMIMGKTPDDYDIATSALPEETLRVFEKDRTIPTGLKHGTVTLVRNEQPYEITTYRIDGEYTDMRRPDKVTFTRTLEQDVLRRDFTINALAWDNEKGIIDYVGGQEDIRRHLIRTVGEPEKRFSEDALRIYRALRFASRLGFTIESETSQSLIRLSGNTAHLAAERVYSEYTKILRGQYAHTVIAHYESVLRKHISCEKSISAPSWQMTARLISEVREKEDTILLWACLLVNAGPAGAADALASLKADTHTLQGVSAVIGAAMHPPENDYALRCLIGDMGEETARRAIWLGLRDDKIKRDMMLAKLVEIVQKGLPCTIASLAIGGEELSKLGFKGKTIGETLRMLLDCVRADLIPNTKESLLKKAGEYLHGDQDKS